MKKKPRGITLLEMVVTISIVAAVLTLGTQLFGGLLQTNQQLITGEEQMNTMDRALHALRVDIENASEVRASATSLQCDQTQWTIEETTLIRTKGGRIDRFALLPATPVFSQEQNRVTLQIGPAAWTIAPLLPKGSP